MAPLASAGPDLDASRGQVVALIGGSTPGTGPLSFTWYQRSGPDVTGGSGRLTGDRPSFVTPPRVASLEFDLVVSDLTGESAPDRLVVSVFDDRERAWFVSPLGSDANSGTRGTPLLSIQAAIAKAAETGGDVYLAGGDYAGSVTLVSGVGLFGGYDPATWLRDPLHFETRIVGGATAIHGSAVQNVALDNLTVVAADAPAANPGASSMGIVLVGASDVEISSVLVLAGAGADGGTGSDGAAHVAAAPSGNDGQNGCADCDGPRTGGPQTAGPEFGGKGGDGGVGSTAPGNGQVGSAGSGGTAGGPAGSGGLSPTNGQPGSDGANGATGSAGVGGAVLGSLVLGQYLPAGGSTASPGSSGRGGGGGGGGGGQRGISVDDGTGGGGGSGGQGGLGGNAGGGGGGGGGSFGIVVSGSSNVSIHDTNVATSSGGAGGRGGNGASGQSGGVGGLGGDNGNGENGAGGRGGKGGAGGAGGAGGGGGGGPSIGIYVAGSSVGLVNNAYSIGVGGAGGPGGNSPAGVAGGNGNPGFARATVGVAVDPQGNSGLALHQAGPTFENQPAGTLIGSLTLETVFPDFSLVAGPGDDNNASFFIQGKELFASVPLDFETRPVMRVRVRRESEGAVERMLTMVLVNNNDPPRCFFVPEHSTTDERELEMVTPFFGVCSPGPAGDGGQQVFYSIQNDRPDLFTSPPVILSDGTLVYDPAPNVRGVATISVQVQDDGGTANSGIDTNRQSFTINIDKPRPWQNAREHQDVTDDGHVAAGDALEIINYINAFRSGRLPPREVIEPPYFDVNGDLFAAPSDVLDVINAINAGAGGEGGFSIGFAERISDGQPDLTLDLMALDSLLAAPATKRSRR